MWTYSNFWMGSKTPLVWIINHFWWFEISTPCFCKFLSMYVFLQFCKHYVWAWIPVHYRWVCLFGLEMMCHYGGFNVVQDVNVFCAKKDLLKLDYISLWPIVMWLLVNIQSFTFIKHWWKKDVNYTYLLVKVQYLYHYLLKMLAFTCFAKNFTSFFHQCFIQFKGMSTLSF